jgi:formylglycine-generating enzyme required for sulfatase activity/serine/threonine protein kinase
MSAATVAVFLESLHALPLLDAAQREQVAILGTQCADIRALVHELSRRGWLTAYQANQITIGRGRELVLDQYLVLDRLGEGGTGVVFKARHQAMRRVVALKLIRKDLVAEPEVVARFHREIEVLSRLSHPNIVHAYDAGPIGPTHFLAMEFIEGIDLARLIQKEGPLPVARAVDYIRQAALGLQHAHERGLVHRDFKPSNLMLTALKRPDAGSPAVDPCVKVLDLGLARFQHKADGRGLAPLTQDGQGMMGTPDYMAPEQAIALHAADTRADVYSLGCTLFYLLTGQPPFPGKSLAEKLMKHQQAEPPALERLRPEAAALAPLVRRTLAKNPADRFQTPGELAAALAPGAAVSAVAIQTRALPLHAGPVQPHDIHPNGRVPLDVSRLGRRHRPPVHLVAGGAALLGLIVLSTIAFLRSGEPDRNANGFPPTREPEVGTRWNRPKESDLVVNSLGMRLVHIPAGKFTMGSPRQEASRGADEDQHEVKISRAFWMGVYPVTQAEYEKVMGVNPSFFSAAGEGKDRVKGLDTRRFPVDQVSWTDAVEFCRKLSALPDEVKAGRTYRLPTEAEWEYACRGRSPAYQVFHVGNTLTSEDANFDGGNPYPEDARKGVSLQRTTRVGSYKPNAFGLYDLHGNVWQWCQDWLGPYDTFQRIDPIGPERGGIHVWRGGSWNLGASHCRSASRHGDGPDTRYPLSGFRVVGVWP